MTIVDEAKALCKPVPEYETLLIKLADSSIPLYDRWEAFTILSEHNKLPTSGWYTEALLDILSPTKEINLYDDFYMERHSVRNHVDFLEHIEDYRTEGDFEYITDDSITAWKEAVLKQGYQGFTFDW